MFEKAIITGCDSTGEDILPMFFHFYKKYNNLPIVFADFGVRNIDKIHKHVDLVIEVNETKRDKGWFNKPYAIRDCPSKQKLWLDTDCQVLCNVEEIFDLFVKDKLNMVEDFPKYMRSKSFGINTGVVGCVGNPKIINRWILETEQNQKQGGDQQLLHKALIKDNIPYFDVINLLPEEYNILVERFEKYEQLGSVKKILHYAGHKNKYLVHNIIRKHKLSL
jgi:hypothetical protein